MTNTVSNDVTATATQENTVTNTVSNHVTTTATEEATITNTVQNDVTTTATEQQTITNTVSDQTTVQGPATTTTSTVTTTAPSGCSRVSPAPAGSTCGFTGAKRGDAGFQSLGPLSSYEDCAFACFMTSGCVQIDSVPGSYCYLYANTKPSNLENPDANEQINDLQCFSCEQGNARIFSYSYTQTVSSTITVTASATSTQTVTTTTGLI